MTSDTPTPPTEIEAKLRAVDCALAFVAVAAQAKEAYVLVRREECQALLIMFAELRAALHAPAETRREKSWLLCPHCLHRWNRNEFDVDAWAACPSCGGSFSYAKPRAIAAPTPTPAPEPPRAGEADDLLWQAFEAGHYAWPNNDTPTRRSLFDKWRQSVAPPLPSSTAAAQAIGGGVRPTREDDSQREWACGCYENQGGYRFCSRHSAATKPDPELVRVPPKYELLSRDKDWCPTCERGWEHPPLLGPNGWTKAYDGSDAIPRAELRRLRGEIALHCASFFWNDIDVGLLHAKWRDALDRLLAVEGAQPQKTEAGRERQG